MCGLAFGGTAPDLGAFESSLTVSPAPASAPAPATADPATMFSISPNLVREYVNISNPESKEGLTIKISDRTGKLWLEQMLGSGTIDRIPVNLEKGIYVVTILSGTVVKHAQKLVVI
jgi:hypothetical protein